MNSSIAASQRRKLPVVVMATRVAAAIGTAMNLLIPKYASASSVYV